MSIGYQNLGSRVGSGQEVFQISRDGLGPDGYPDSTWPLKSPDINPVQERNDTAVIVATVLGTLPLM